MDKKEYLEKRTVLLNEADKLIVENKIEDFEMSTVGRGI